MTPWLRAPMSHRRLIAARQLCPAEFLDENPGVVVLSLVLDGNRDLNGAVGKREDERKDLVGPAALDAAPEFPGKLLHVRARRHFGEEVCCPDHVPGVATAPASLRHAL